jgi:hypothetical protein
MACCNLRKRMADKNGNCPSLVRTLATHHSKINETDVQIYHETKAGFGRVFDFEEVKKGRSQIVEVIKFRKPKSKSVLRNTKKRKPIPVEDKPKAKD